VYVISRAKPPNANPLLRRRLSKQVGDMSTSMSNISTGWQAARAPADGGVGIAGIDDLSWMPAQVPGTAAGALRDAGLWRTGDLGNPVDFDAEDWWFRTCFVAEPVLPGEEVRLCLDGIATVAEVYLNGELVLESDSMFLAHALDVTERLLTDRGSHRSPTGGENELAICCHALGPLLEVRRRPRARWRTRLVASGNLRFFRTMLLGRLPGIAPEPATVGPWRAVRLERRRLIEMRELKLLPRVEGNDGILAVRAQVRALNEAQVSSVEVELTGSSSTHRVQLAVEADGDSAAEISAQGELRVPGVGLWWPHTHGEPVLHEVRVRIAAMDETVVIDGGRVGFRKLAFGATSDHDIERDGLDLHVNGVRVFMRGAVWTPVDPIGLNASEQALRAALRDVRDAGMNMVRLAGTCVYETPAFYDLCDELGIVVWQDFMFANLDYPISDDDFRASVTREARQVLVELAGRPSLAVVCGNSEVEQQVAMTGFDLALGRGELFGELLPELVRESGADALYVPSAPCGAGLPFWPGRGIGTYYGVGTYKLPLEDARRAGVRFAVECLAFSHVPVQESVAAIAPSAGGHEDLERAWRAGIPRENGAEEDFEDVRDHYLQLLFGVDPAELRRVDRARYLQLSRVLTGEILAEVFGEWRRAGSPCGGGLVLWLRDLLPGAGWGLIDWRGLPKVAYHHLARVLAPVAVWTTDEQLNGIVAHVANDRPAPLQASLRIAMYRDGEHRVEEASVPVELTAHSQGEWNVETVIGRFVDAGWAYRFGAPAQDVVVVTLERDDEERAGGVISQAVRFPTGRPLTLESAEQLGLVAETNVLPDGDVLLTMSSRRVVYGLEVHASSFSPSDNGCSIEPGGTRVVRLCAREGVTGFAGCSLTAVNLEERMQATRR
jgi:beta-mannosidase